MGSKPTESTTPREPYRLEAYTLELIFGKAASRPAFPRQMCLVCGADIRHAPRGIVLKGANLWVNIHRHCIGKLIRALEEHRKPVTARETLE